MKNSRSRPGFTIVELLIVVVVIAILAAIVIVSYNGITQRARESVVQSDLSTAAKQLELEKTTAGSYPATKEAANSGAGLKASTGTVFQYNTPYGADNGYCLTATNGTIAYYISSSEGTPKKGACSGNNTVVLDCPSGFIQVPGNSTFGTNDFCVMKYEAKNVGGYARSQVAGTPWVNISQTAAISESAVSCEGCHLITEAEWMTIAANVLSVASNWSGGAVGSGYIYSGHSRNPPGGTLAASTDNDGYNGTGATSGERRRTLNLSNGEVIWDLVGNIWEWTQGTIAANGQPGTASDSLYTWREWNSSALTWNGLAINNRPESVSSSAANWSSTQGIGALYSNRNDGALRGFQRGGAWGDSGSVGVLALSFYGLPSYTSGNVGFRVAK